MKYKLEIYKALTTYLFLKFLGFHEYQYAWFRSRYKMLLSLTPHKRLNNGKENFRAFLGRALRYYLC